ncbi:hypothetical protein NL676_030092 [Syzygium grande]|nr:hypothetical protein NL676_030092 [Syzygium grande]
MVIWRQWPEVQCPKWQKYRFLAVKKTGGGGGDGEVGGASLMGTRPENYIEEIDVAELQAEHLRQKK